MDFLYENVIRPLLFRLDPERAHEWGVEAMAALGRCGWLCRGLAAGHALPVGRFRSVEVAGLHFPNHVGLAAGFDKDARAWPAAAALGFGHVEVGTVTALPQPGNPKPRVFRYPARDAVINRMGFNNAGAERMAARLARLPGPGRRPIPVGINLGKSKVVPLESAVQDYLTSFGLLADYADYLVLNVSSPNTPDLRKLQDESRLHELLGAVGAANRARGAARRPLFLKIAPDLTYRQIDAVLEAILAHGIDGIIATNTTLARPVDWPGPETTGGLSGRPLRRRSTQIVHYIAQATAGRLPLIAAGGIDDPASAAEKLDAGAHLVQIYTGMIFRGPSLAAHLARALAERQRTGL
jgi:dihydroorotate dehydrogenase